MPVLKNKNISNIEIIEAIRTGKGEEIVKYLYKKVFPKVKMYICSNSGRTEDAFDIFQDAVLILCKQVKMNKYNEQYEVDGFIFSVARNLWINKVKKEKRITSIAENYVYNSTENDFSDFILTKEKENMIKTVLGKLGEKCAELLQYSVFHRFSNREICEKMGYTSEDAVKTRKYKCKQKLIEIMEEFPAVKELIQ